MTTQYKFYVKFNTSGANVIFKCHLRLAAPLGLICSPPSSFPSQWSLGQSSSSPLNKSPYPTDFFSSSSRRSSRLSYFAPSFSIRLHFLISNISIFVPPFLPTKAHKIIRRTCANLRIYLLSICPLILASLLASSLSSSLIFNACLLPIQYAFTFFVFITQRGKPILAGHTTIQPNQIQSKRAT